MYINRGSMKTTIRLPTKPGTTGPVARFLYSHDVDATIQEKKIKNKTKKAKDSLHVLRQSYGEEDSQVYQQAGS